MTTAFVLTERDAQVLREMLSDFKRRNLNSGGRQEPEFVSDLHQAPETYVAEVTTAIPGLTVAAGTGATIIPGASTCALYRLLRAGSVNGRLVPLHVSVAVHNLSEDPIAVDSLILVERDKFGTWWAVPVVSLPAEGCAELVTDVDCVSNSIVVTTTYVRAVGLTTSSTPC